MIAFASAVKRAFSAVLISAVFLTLTIVYSYASEISLVCTGDTHAMLYPCNCPREPDGGISRRAALVKTLRARHPGLLLVDSGGFFAGGQLDTYTQNTELDNRRTVFNLRGMHLIGYDAVAVGPDEFNFGIKFLEENIKAFGIPAVSANIKAPFLKRFIIKETGGARVGITAVEPLSVSSRTNGLEVGDPLQSLKAVVSEMKGANARLIVLLSGLSEQDSRIIVKEIPEIDVVVLSRSSGEGVSFQFGNALFLRPSWQGRSLVKAELSFENGKVKTNKAQALRLSSDIADDKQAAGFLPSCFSDGNCKREGMIGSCLNPGVSGASCVYRKPARVDLTVITMKDCLGCDTDSKIEFLRGQFKGLSVNYVYYPGTKANALISKTGLSTLPGYLLGTQVENEPAFAGLKDKLELKGDYYVLSPAVGGIAFYLQRRHIKGKLDIFMNLYEGDVPGMLTEVRGLNPGVHFLATDNNGKLESMRGKAETEEYLRAVCVRKYAPDSFWDYITCRARDINSSWWEDCFVSGSVDAGKISACAKSEEGAALLKEDISLNKDLGVMSGPTYLLNNVEIFGIRGIPAKEELKRLLGEGPRR